MNTAELGYITLVTKEQLDNVEPIIVITQKTG